MKNIKIRINKLIVPLIIIGILLLNIPSYAEEFYSGDNYTLRQVDDDLIMSVKYDDKTEIIDVLKFNNFTGSINEVKVKDVFLDKNNRIDEYDSSILKQDVIPHIHLYGPMEIKSLEDNIWFETLILNKNNDKYDYTGYYYYLKGISNYKVFDKALESFEIIPINTGEESIYLRNLDKENIKYEFINTIKNGKIVSEKGRLNVKGKETLHDNFLLAGDIRKTNLKLPNVLITVDFNGENKIKNKENPNSKFSDVYEYNWFYEDVHKLVDKGVISGYNDGTFKPNKDITLGEFLKASVSIVSDKNIQKTPGHHWAKGFYDEAVNLNIINKTDFKPTSNNFNKSISREDMAYILVNINERVQGSPNVKSKHVEKDIKDFHNVSQNRRKHVLQAYSKDLIKGKDGKFDPKGSVTRAETATVLMRLIEY